MLYNLDSRCKDILNYLLYVDGYTTIQHLSTEKNISKRSVYYDLCKINDWLQSHNITPIIVERRKGICLSLDQRDHIINILQKVSENSLYLFSPMERVKIIICTILKRSKPVYIEDFINLCHVSRNTIISDLKVVVTKLQESNLSLTYENKEGYIIKGDVIRKRSVFFLMFSNLSDLYKKKIIPLENESKVIELYNRLKQVESDLHADYVSGILFSIAVFFASLPIRSEILIFSIRDKIEISHTNEYKLVCKYFQDFNESEQYYLSLHLLGSRLQTIPITLMKESDEESYTLAKALVAEFSRIACIDFDEIDEIEQALFAHLKTSLYRYRFGIQLSNPMLNDIKTQYPELFGITKKACEYLEQQIGVPIPDGEVAYITLHFGGYIENNRINKDTLNILIICPNGISTSNMLRKEVRDLIPHAHQIDVVSLSKFASLKQNYNVIISTVAISDVKNLIIVHPILTDNDRVIILKKCMLTEFKYNIDIQAILSIAKPYIDPQKLDKYKQDLIRNLSTINTNSIISTQNYGHGIMNYLSLNHINIIDKKITWKDALYSLGKTLLNENSIEDKYIEAIIQKNLTLGPCMFITDNVVLAHAKVEDGALSLSVNLGIFHNPILFTENRTCQIIIFLVAIDQESHLKILNDIMTIFSDNNNIDRIIACKNKSELIHTFNDILNN